MAPKKIALVTDSCADLSRALIEENDIHVIPLRISCADGEFSDGVDISAADVYTRLHAGELPKTSLPTGEDVERVLRTLVKEGYDGAIAIMLSSGLSGSIFLITRYSRPPCPISTPASSIITKLFSRKAPPTPRTG